MNSQTKSVDDLVRQLEFKNGVSEALRWYVSDAAFQADVPKVRKELSKLKRILERLNEQLPGETTLLGHFLSKTYDGTCFCAANDSRQNVN